MLLSRNYSKQFSIESYHTCSQIKTAIVERFNRTLDGKLRLHFVKNKNHKWLAILPDILTDYNENHVQRTMVLPPALVKKKNEQEVHKRIYTFHFKLEQPVFDVGGRVRTTKYKSTFANKYEERWRKEIFTISKVHYTDPIFYSVEDSDGEEI